MGLTGGLAEDTAGHQQVPHGDRRPSRPILSLTLCVCHPPFIWSFQQPDLSHEPGKSRLLPPSSSSTGIFGGEEGGLGPASIQTSQAPTWGDLLPLLLPLLPAPWLPSQPLPLGTRQPPTIHAERAGLTGLWLEDSPAQLLWLPHPCPPSLNPALRTCGPLLPVSPTLDLTKSLKAGLPSLPHPSPPSLPSGSPVSGP